MLKGILGRKIEMTQLFDEKGNLVPITVLQCGPCVVLRVKNVERDGYQALQLGLVEEKRYRAGKPHRGHVKKAGASPEHVKFIREIRLTGECDLKEGNSIATDIFEPGDRVDVVGISKGKGFQGVIRRHGFKGGRMTHGSMFHRAPGSIGASAYPSRVYPGMKGAGRMGGKRRTVKNLEVVKVDKENQLLLVKGGVPGARHSALVIVSSKTQKNKESSDARA